MNRDMYLYSHKIVLLIVGFIYVFSGALKTLINLKQNQKQNISGGVGLQINGLPLMLFYSSFFNFK